MATTTLLLHHPHQRVAHEDNDEDDELLSVGSETPPPVMPLTDHLIALTPRLQDDDDDDSDAKTDVGSASQSSDSCSRSSISRCSLMTECYSTSSSVTSPKPEELLNPSPSLRDNVFSRPSILQPQPTRPSNSANNNVSMRALKFSIDNILKPEFGRQTTPIYNIPSYKKNPSGGSLFCEPRTSSSGGVCVGKGRGNVGAVPIDLSKVVSPEVRETSTAGSDASSAANGKPSSPAATSGTLPSAGSSQMMWPAWVYCTRYSDRPSSGKSAVALILIGIIIIITIIIIIIIIIIINNDNNDRYILRVKNSCLGSCRFYSHRSNRPKQRNIIFVCECNICIKSLH